MAEVRIEGSDLEGAVLVNAATEETLQELVKAINEQSTGGGGSRSSSNPLDWLTEGSDDAESAFSKLKERIDETNDDLKQNSDSFKKYGKSVQATTKTLNVFDRSIGNIGDVGDDVQSQLSSMGSAVGGATSKVADSLQIAGAALSFIPGVGQAARLVGGGLITTGTALGVFKESVVAAAGVLGGVVGIAEGFRTQYEQLTNTGFILDSQFGQLIDRTNTAGMTINDFTQFVDRNRQDLILFSGSVSRGANSVLDLRNKMNQIDDDMVDRFIRMGVSIEEIPDVISNYMVVLARSGRRMQQSDEQMLQSAEELFKQQRLLADLTGENVGTIQQEANERLRAGRIQATLAEVGADAANAYNQVSGIIKTLGPEYAQAFEAAFAVDGGDLTDQMYQGLITAAPEIKAVLDQLAVGIKSGAISQEDAIETTFEALRQSGSEISGNLSEIAGKIQYSGVDTPFQLFAGSLSDATARMAEIRNMSPDQFREFRENLEKTAEGQKDAAGAIDPLLQSFTNIERGTKDVQIALQEVAAEISTTFSDDATDIFKAFADSIAGFTDVVLNKVDALQGITVESTKPASFSSESLLQGVGAMSATGAGIGAGAGSMAGGVGALPGALVGALVGAGITLGNNLLGDIFGYSDGGVANASDTGSLAVLHGTEAVVPLPDGKSIPVSFRETPTMSGPNRANANFANSMDFAKLQRDSAAQTNQLFSSLIESVNSLESRMIAVGNFAEKEIEISSAQNQKTENLINLSKNMLNQMILTAERTEKMVKGLNEANANTFTNKFSRA